MKINYKTIEHERVEDAPFIGALISAVDCHRGCKNCFNQNAKKMPTISREAEDIVSEIKSNPFNEGVVFGGLDWLLQKDELLELASLARANGLKTMLYAGCELDEIDIREISSYFDYVKTGAYVEDLFKPHVEYGVTLSTSNQKIRDEFYLAVYDMSKIMANGDGTITIIGGIGGNE